MPFPIRTCAICKEDFELTPNKPGFANRCLQCTEEEAEAAAPKLDADERKSQAEANEARRAAMKNLLYRKDS